MMKRIIRKIREWRDRRFLERMQRVYPDSERDRDFKDRLQRVYPDAERFLETISAMPCETELPVFRLDSHIVAWGSVSAIGAGPNSIYAREAIACELSGILKEWAHPGDIPRISIDRSHKGGDLVFQITFRKNPSGDNVSDERSEIL